MRLFINFLTMISFLYSGLSAMSHEANGKNPSDAYKMHICAFHLAKDDPSVVIETQHYCTDLSDGIFQCLLYETTQGTKPKLLGVEYVISNDHYQKLPENEKKYWHPHDYEVRQGLLALVGATKEEDESTMKVLVNTWGKTWHTWPDPKTELPIGNARLMWSATQEGQIPQEMITQRDRQWGIDTEKLKKNRALYLKPESK